MNSEVRKKREGTRLRQGKLGEVGIGNHRIFLVVVANGWALQIMRVSNSGSRSARRNRITGVDDTG
jgi:hypothetical protein